MIAGPTTGPIAGPTAGPMAELLAELPLVDGHCHPLLVGPVDAAAFAQYATEADRPPPAGVSYLDSSLGLAIRRWCPPALGLASGASVTEYLDCCAQLGEDEVSARLLRAARLSHLLVDTGLTGPDLTSLSLLKGLAGAEVREVVRLERIAEQVASTGVSAGRFASMFIDQLAATTQGAVAVKSILAYRYGFAIDPDRPDPAEVRAAAGDWLARPGPPRLDHPVLLRFVLWCGIDLGLPLQVHAGLGDRDVHLTQADPTLLQPFLEAVEPTGVPVVLLHCYPYHRQAGWLAQVYPHVYVDVGLTVAQVGAHSDVVLAEFCELAPFGKLLFSTDAYRLPERYLVGAAQFRHSLAKLLDRWVADRVMPMTDAQRVAALVAAGNAQRLYQL